MGFIVVQRKNLRNGYHKGFLLTNKIQQCVIARRLVHNNLPTKQSQIAVLPDEIASLNR